VCLIILFEQTTISTKPTAWHKSKTASFVEPLHFGTAFWMLIDLATSFHNQGNIAMRLDSMQFFYHMSA
jgi:hypothetical protein